MAAPFLSRDDIEQIAQKILSIYSDAYVPKNHMFYTVEPELLAEVLGIAVDYQMLSLDGSILGVTSPDEQMVSVFYDNEECYYYLDGYTVLVDCRLRDSEKLVGRKNYTLAHEIAHQVLYKAFPNAYTPQTGLHVTIVAHVIPTRKSAIGWSGRQTLSPQPF